MAVINYDPAAVKCTFGILDLARGCPADGGIRIRPEAVYRSVKGCDGEVARVRAAVVNATIEVDQFAGSEAHLELMTLMSADAVTGLGVLPFQVTHIEGREVYASALCWVDGPVERSYSGTQDGAVVMWRFTAMSFFAVPIPAP